MDASLDPEQRRARAVAACVLISESGLEVVPRSRVRTIRNALPGSVCECGARIPVGARVSWQPDRRCIVECPSCRVAPAAPAGDAA